MDNKIYNEAEIINPIGYEGNVKIEVIDTDGRIRLINKYNKGAEGLFTSIARALAGYDIEKYKPKYLMLYTGTERILSSKIIYTNTPTLYRYDAERNIYERNIINCDVIEYVFTIPIASIGKTATNSNSPQSINRIELLNDANLICAYITLLEDDAFSLDSTIGVGNIVIYWKLHFKNFET